MHEIFKKLYRDTLFSEGAAILPNLETLPGTYPKEYPDAAFHPLPENPEPHWVETDIRQLLLNRRSRHAVRGQPIDRATLSALLRYSAGVTGYMRAYGYRNYPLRAFPSAGGLQATELYLGVSDAGTDFLPPGVYHYNAVRHGLESLGGEEAWEKMWRALLVVQIWLREPPPLMMVLTLDHARLHRKYDHHAARLSLADPGFLGENVYLVGEALGLAVTVMCGFHERQMMDLMQLDLDGGEFPILALTVGRRLPPTHGLDESGRE